MIGVGDKFWGMTLREFHLALDGYRMRQDGLARLVFSAALLVRNVWTKRNVKLSQILKTERKPHLVSASDADSYFRGANKSLREKKAHKERELEGMMRRGA